MADPGNSRVKVHLSMANNLMTTFKKLEECVYTEGNQNSTLFSL